MKFERRKENAVSRRLLHHRESNPEPIQPHFLLFSLLFGLFDNLTKKGENEDFLIHVLLFPEY